MKEWSEIKASPPPLTMRGLLAFMERWKPGSTAKLEPATQDQIFWLADPHGGIDVLPAIYREFLEVMGESTGELSLLWGTTSASALITDFREPNGSHPDPQRFVKFGLGEDDYNGRHPDDFFDLSQSTSAGRDAAVIRIHEHLLLSPQFEPKRPFASFSDYLRGLATIQLTMKFGEGHHPTFFDFGTDATASAKTYEVMTNLGFTTNELGASEHCVPLEKVGHRAVALLLGPSGTVPATRLHMRVSDDDEFSRLKAVLDDHSRKIRGL